MLENVAELVFDAAHEADDRLAGCASTRDIVAQGESGEIARTRCCPDSLPPLAVFEGPSEALAENPRPPKSHDESTTHWE